MPGLFTNLTPEQEALNLLEMTPEQLSQLDHATLYRSRAYLPKELQSAIAPYEHQAFAREATAESPWMALPITMGTLLYQPYKAVMGARSEPSLEQVKKGLKGVKEGLMKSFMEESLRLRYQDPFKPNI